MKTRILFIVLCIFYLGSTRGQSQYTWISGSNGINQNGIYGTKGMGSNSNIPGARYRSTTWEVNNTLWLFGGAGHDSSGNYGLLNDLWNYNKVTGQWTWVSGSNNNYQNGTYGTQGIESSSNIPGSRYGHISWEENDTLWLFGGYGRDGFGNEGPLNDLWRYNRTTGNWTWVSGNDTMNKKGIYGTQGVGSALNVPGARFASIAWIENDTLWLFGGQGRDGFGNYGELNDLWKFNKINGHWTWVGGNDTMNKKGIYGTQGIGSTLNIPGARYQSISWVENDTLWLFGGIGRNFNGGLGYLNDLWKYNKMNGQWTWVSGTKNRNETGTYGTQGIGSISNIPGGRLGSISWMENDTLWLFGGRGYDGSGNFGHLNDLWIYNKINSQWTWIGGSNARDQNGTYGTQGVGGVSNFPGGRFGSIAWIDNDTLWLFGGSGVSGSSFVGNLNDLWKLKFNRCSNPTIPVITAGSTCLGGSVSINISGTLNSASHWYIYTGSCGGTLIDSTSTTGITLSPTTSTDYYIRGEGGCVTPGACGSGTIYLHDLPVISQITSSRNPVVNGYAPQACADLTVSASGAAPLTYTWGSDGSGNPLNVCPSVGRWYQVTVTDVNGCQRMDSIRQYVINASTKYPGRVYVCHQSNPRRPQYYTITINTAQVPYYLGLGATFGPCGSTPSKVSGYEIVDLEDIYKIYPNPFNTELNIEFFSLFDEEVNITLTDMNGRELKTLMNERVYEGSMNRISTDASDLPSGMYLIRYVSDTDIRVQKVILNR